MGTTARVQQEQTDARQFLRHAIATLAYRGGKAIRGVSDDFAGFRSGTSTRTPAQVLAHISDLLDWARNLAEGRNEGHDSEPLAWAEEVQRFYRELQSLDDLLASDKPLGAPAEKLFQGPVADALTHVGQLTMLRRMAGTPVKGENYFVARIATGCVSATQPDPVREFD